MDGLVSVVRLAAGPATTAVREMLGTSRKYALPILECLDRRGVTAFDGQRRSLRTGA